MRDQDSIITKSKGENIPNFHERIVNNKSKHYSHETKKKLKAALKQTFAWKKLYESTIKIFSHIFHAQLSRFVIKHYASDFRFIIFFYIFCHPVC